MDEKEKTPNESAKTEHSHENDIPNEIGINHDYDDPNEYLDQYMNESLYYDSMCIACKHWSGNMCNVDNCICNFEMK